MKDRNGVRMWLPLWGVLALALAIGGPATAEMQVSGPFFDATTGGDWRETYGECFFLVPDVDEDRVEVPTGPGLHSQFPGQYMDCVGGELSDTGNIDYRIFKAEETQAFTWTDLANWPAESGQVYNPCRGERYFAVWDDHRFANDPLSLELVLTAGGDMRVAYFFTDEGNICRGDLAFELLVDGVLEASGTIGPDLRAGHYVYFDLTDVPGTGATLTFRISDAGNGFDCVDPYEQAGLNSLLGGAFINGTTVCQPAPIPCRFTGGGVDTDGNWDHSLEDGSMVRNGAGNLPEGVDRYQFGGQAGASTAQPPDPSGEWTHSQQRGPSGRFTFHGGTNSAPEGTRIVEIRCSDPENCNPARKAPAKQLDFDGIGTFKSIGSGGNAPTWAIPDANVTAEGNGNQDFDGTFHWFEVNVDDLGEPGGLNAGAPDSEACPSSGFGEKGAVPLANCDCPDFYRITIYDGVDAATLASSGPNKDDVIYEVYGYIDGGNLQIHPPTGNDTN